MKRPIDSLANQVRHQIRPAAAFATALKPFRRWGWHSAGMVTTAALALAGLSGLASPAAAASDQAAPPVQHLAVTSLAFSPRLVDARQFGGSGADLAWTTTDSLPAATNIYGELTIAAPGAKPGTYDTEVLDASFSLRGSSQAAATGSPRKASFVYSFQVPEFDKVAAPTWKVTSLTVRDNKGDELVMSAQQIGKFKASMTSEELVDTAQPTSESFELAGTLRPFIYSGVHAAGSQTYNVCVLTPSGWFVRGSLDLSGPHSKSFGAQFNYNPAAPNCADPYTNAEGQEYVIPVKFPAGLAAGTWTVSRLELMDSAGNVSTAVNLGAPVTVTGNQVLTASQFTASPNPANDWAGDARVTASMKVAGATDSVTAIYLDFTGEQSGQQINCQASPGPLTPVSTGPGRESVQFDMTDLTPSCQVDGIAILDGAGHLALYGSMYGAPDPDLTVRQVPDTTTPVATSASISSNGLQAGLYLLTIGVQTHVAPVANLAMRIYNSDNVLQTAADSNGGVDQQPGGSVTYIFGGGLSPGTYAVGFTIWDSGGLSTSYGPGGTKPMPGGTLKFTVPSS